ncbi:hypothetical protein ACQ4PT_009445 [Festuca glaucescens]
MAAEGTKSLAFGKPYRKLMMKKLLDEHRISVEETMRRMMEDPSLRKPMDEEEVLRLMRKADDERKRMASKRKQEPQAAADQAYPRDQQADDEEFIAARYRDKWEYRWSGTFGSYEDTTRIPAMRYTDEPPAPRYRNFSHMHTFNIFSLKLARMDGDLQWPLHVFGIVAARDFSDHNRNIIFHRNRDNCQIIHQEDPYLELTGYFGVRFYGLREGKVPVDADGMIVLSRRVVCVELDGKLKVSVMARCGDEKEDVSYSDDKVFTPKEAGRSHYILKVESCEMEVTVAWSVFSDEMFARGDWAGYSRSSSPPGICDEYFDLANEDY